MAVPDRAKADSLSRAKKVITEQLEWQVVGTDRYRLEAKILVPGPGEVLKFRGNKGRNNFSFVLLYKNYPIRKLTYHHRHTRPNGQQIINTLHKHIWDETNEDRDCYIPDDIEPDANVNEALVAFLAEENIELTESYQFLLV